MKDTPIALFIAILFICGSSLNTYAQHQQPREFKVLSYNIQAGQAASLEELSDFIKSENPDFVALQEVDSHTFREGIENQHGKDFATEIGYYTGMYPGYGKTIEFAGGYYGIGLLSKYPIDRLERIYLPMTEEGEEQRAILLAKVEYEEGQYVTFASTHLDYTTSKERQIQIDKIKEIIAKENNPVILAGDLNATPEAPEIVEGFKDWQPHYNPEDFTFSTENPKVHIDYIFSYPKDRWKAVQDTTYSTIHLSDHFPIGSRLILK